MKKLYLSIIFSIFPILSFASEESMQTMHEITNPLTILAVIIFIFAYALVMIEDVIHLNKSKPVVLVAGIIWVLTAIVGNSIGQSHIVSENFNHIMIEYGELLLFLVVAMAYINLMEDRNIFEKLKSILVNSGFSFLKIFWLTGILSFFISAVADNLTTALVMCTVVLAIGKSSPKFTTIACVNVVVAANAGGAFSPFGDITTLMVWQHGIISFTGFFDIFIPSLVNFLVPAIIMSFFIPKMPKQSIDIVEIKLKKGAIVVVCLFILTIITAVTFEQILHLPAALGMVTGLGYVMFFDYFYGLKLKRNTKNIKHSHKVDNQAFNIFDNIKNAEWDTLLFFYGVLVAVQGLVTLGLLGYVSKYIYIDMPSIAPSIFSAHTQANTIIGMLSAVIDNIPVMFAVLSMNPTMEHSQWLLVTLTCGVGGSLLSVGSAAGVAVMGKSKGKYTFMGHLKWTWAIALGYFASIAIHIIIS